LIDLHRFHIDYGNPSALRIASASGTLLASFGFIAIAQ
jgi:hypothetical protein